MAEEIPRAHNCMDPSTSKLENNWRPVKILGIIKVVSTTPATLMCILLVKHPVREEKRLELLPTKYLWENHRTFLFDYYSSRLRFDLPMEGPPPILPSNP